MNLTTFLADVYCDGMNERYLIISPNDHLAVRRATQKFIEHRLSDYYPSPTVPVRVEVQKTDIAPSDFISAN